MKIKPIVTLCSLLLLSIFILQCDKKISEIIHTEEIVEEPISYDQRTDRNDIPPPPLIPWSTIDPAELTTCQLNLWVYLNKFYPIQDSINPEYQIYTIKNQAQVLYYADDVLAFYAKFFNEDFSEDYLYNDEYSCPEELGAKFFERVLGEPTCIAYNHLSNVITYFYYTKLRFRYGPCPFTIYNGEEVGSHCGSTQIRYCATLRAIFSMETG